MFNGKTQLPIAAESDTNGGDSLLISAETLARLLNVSVRTLWRLRSRGSLPVPIKLGGSVRWRMDEIEAWIAAGCPEIASTTRLFGK